jgi:hypothetical protein
MDEKLAIANEMPIWIVCGQRSGLIHLSRTENLSTIPLQSNFT